MNMHQKHIRMFGSHVCVSLNFKISLIFAPEHLKRKNLNIKTATHSCLFKIQENTYARQCSKLMAWSLMLIWTYNWLVDLERAAKQKCLAKRKVFLVENTRNIFEWIIFIVVGAVDVDYSVYFVYSICFFFFWSYKLQRWTLFLIELNEFSLSVFYCSFCMSLYEPQKIVLKQNTWLLCLLMNLWMYKYVWF